MNNGLWPILKIKQNYFLVVVKKNLVNLEESCSFFNARSAIGPPSGLWTEECTERKNVRFISVHAVNLKKKFSASSLMFIAFSAMSRNFFVGLLGRSLHGSTVHLILHRDSKDGYASRTRKDPPARTSPYTHIRTWASREQSIFMVGSQIPTYEKRFIIVGKRIRMRCCLGK